MLKKFYIILSLGFILNAPSLRAQELNAQVQVISSNIQATNRQIYNTLETSVREFLNNRKWTNETYEPDERISCQFILNLTGRNGDQFSGDLQVLYSRPIYKSGYNSPVLVIRDDKFSFQYLEFDRLDFALNTNLSNLTSILAYYAYVVIGLDHDTYALKGGDPFFENAQQIVGNAQGGSYSGWSSFDGNKNRFWLVDNLTSPAFENFRTMLYQYHRHGLDLMYEPARQKDAKETIKNSLLMLEEVNKQRRSSYLMQVFFDTKSQEIINIFSGGEPIDLTALKELLIELDANNASKYEGMGRA